MLTSILNTFKPAFGTNFIRVKRMFQSNLVFFVRYFQTWGSLTSEYNLFYMFQGHLVGSMVGVGP